MNILYYLSNYYYLLLSRMCVRAVRWYRAADRKCKRYFCPGVYGSAPPERPPPGRSIASLYRCLRPPVGALALSGSTSHGGGGVYHFACLFACLLRAEVGSCILYICAV